MSYGSKNYLVNLYFFLEKRFTFFFTKILKETPLNLFFDKNPYIIIKKHFEDDEHRIKTV